MSVIYGVNTEEEVTPTSIRDAIITCFCGAHSAQTGLNEVDLEETKRYCTEIVKKAFIETKGDFVHPTKEALISTLPWLARFSKSFRDQEVINAHMTEIQHLITLIKE
jgi:hypothetical protein